MSPSLYHQANERVSHWSQPRMTSAGALPEFLRTNKYGTLRETCLPVTLNGNMTTHAWKICETLKCSGNDLYRNYRNCNCFSCCNSKTTTTDVAAFCCTCSCHLQLTMPPTTSSLHHHSFCCFCELTYSHRKRIREFEESGLPGFGYESCSHESCSKQDMHQS